FKSQGVNKVNKNNIIFTISSTHAFGLISEIIARPKDVILMTGPNYGLFTFVPERQSNATIEILPLSLEDNWYVNPKKLAAKIDEINKKLAVEYKDKLDYIPKVVAFLNENPHNPLGKVMNEKNENILKGIGEVCLNKGVFVIDDIIYRDTTYDRNNLSKPIGSYDKYFSNTITITGLSKSYGMASIRSGMVMADEIIIRGIRNKIFQTMDSMPVLQSKALEGAFNTSKEREIEYKKYFDPIIKEYKYRYQLMKAMISGIDSIDNKEVRLLVEKEIRKTLLNDYNLNNILEGIPNVDFVKNTTPEAGFFELIDYTNLKYKETEKHSYITNELDLLKYMYEEQKIKLILGGSISWPNEDELIGRITTALPRDEIINNLGAMNKCLRKLR
ncbi:MAG: pyridoxal phosphate-dependent aminotransferase, partial [Bacilli bacterium]